jgi:4-hydroxy-2-oxoheptanedioate aldolase
MDVRLRGQTDKGMGMESFRETLRSGCVQFGLAITYPAPGVVERIGPDWDWIWIDGQHGELGYNETLALVRACDLIGRPALVRVPGHEAGPIGLALDMGASGVIVPCVDTPDQARSIVQAAKFPPLGNRSYGGRRIIDLHGRRYSDTANHDTVLVVQIETPEALDNVEAIAAIAGVDALLLGTDDLLMRHGVSMDAPRNRENLGPLLETMLHACRKHGKASMMVGMSEDLLRFGVERGFQLIASGIDARFLTNGSKQASAAARAVAHADRQT